MRRCHLASLQPHVSPLSLGRATSSSSGDKPSFQRRAWARAKLTADEWQERREELQERSVGWLKSQRARSSNFSANDFCERSHYKWKVANNRFDDWFNAQWPIWSEDMRQRVAAIREGRMKPDSQLTKVIQSPFDMPALLLVGAGVGSVIAGWAPAGVLLVVWGSTRGVRRFVIQKVDEEDREGLYRWLPASWGPARCAEIFNRIQYEVHVSRKIREGDPNYTTYSEGGGQRHKAMDPLNDYTPEKLFEDAMTSVAAHPRILETLGGKVKVVSDPDKVVYRIVEGIAEVYLGWHIQGQTAGAEIQVKSTACLLDYIYVFPEATGRFVEAPPAFVIRPNGDWSQNVDELNRYMKSPFGKKGDTEKLYPNRSGVFEMDWTTREFKHGKENRFDGSFR